MLAKDTLRTCTEYLTVARRGESAEHRAQTYHRLVFRGKLRTAVRLITEREMVVVLQPGEWCSNTEDRVMEVLRAKHPEAQAHTLARLYSYLDRPPELVSVKVTDDTV